MYWHPPTDTVYLAHPRTASQATSRALMEQAGFRCVGSHHDGIERAMEVQPHRGPADLEGLWTFCVVRDHFDAVVSWLYGGEREARPPIGPDQVDEIVEVHAASYIEPGRLWPFAARADEVVRFERLPRALNDVLGMRGLGPVELPRENVSSGRPDRSPSELISPAGRRRIRELWGREMEALGYRYRRQLDAGERVG